MASETPPRQQRPSEPPRPGSVSVVIRSYKRIPALCELLEAVRAQDYHDFEIVVVEQTPELAAADRAALASSANDPRVRILWSPPLGPAGARNVGWQAAHNEIVLFMDDDDLPLGRGWIGAHVANYASPEVIGVSGREVLTPKERCGYRLRWLARRWCLAYDLLGTPHVFCRLDERRHEVDWLHGGNASIRREWLERVGGWDPRFVDHEEHSFCWRLLSMRGEHRLVFDPEPCMLRRKGVAGGLERRRASIESTYGRWHRYYHTLVREHRPLRFALLYPLYALLPLFMSVRFVWKDSAEHRSLSARCRETARALACFPAWYLRALRDDADNTSLTARTEPIRAPGEPPVPGVL